MYEQHYGLDRRLFLSYASANEVFVGPQTAKYLHGAKKALAAPEAAVAIIGEPGVGKTTLVNRSLEASELDLCVIRIPRLQLGHDEILEFLLEELGAENIPASTIRKIALLKRKITERMSSGTRVVVVIEDAVWIGEDALAELEALTAADSEESEGANLMLMGDGTLRKILQSDSLARLYQRVRFHSVVKPMSSQELTAYLKHAFRLAGGDFDQLFVDDAALYLHRLTAGIPRIANNLVESILVAGAEKRLATIDNALIARIAQDEYGLKAEFPITDTAGLDPAAHSAAPAASDTGATSRMQRELDVDMLSESRLGVGPKFGITAIISETSPDLDKLAAGIGDANDEAADSDDQIDLANLPDSVLSRLVEGDDDIPTLYDSGRLKVAMVDSPAKSGRDIPTLPVALEAENDGDATPPPVDSTNAAAARQRAIEKKLTEHIAGKIADNIAENIAIATEALEKHDATIAEYLHSSAAFAEYANQAERQPEASAATAPSTPAGSNDAGEIWNVVPESPATSSAEIQVAETDLQDHPGHEPAMPDDIPEVKLELEASPDVDATAPVPDPAVSPPAAAALHAKVAGELSVAESLDDVDDLMAESLFSTQIGKLAKQAAGELPVAENTTDAPALALVDEPPPQPAAATTGETSSESRPEPPNTARPAATGVPGKPPALAMTATQRLETVRALNARGRPPSVPIPATAAAGTPVSAPPPRPIEDQIKTVVPEALRALGAVPNAANDDVEDDETIQQPRKRGFFSRFRRS